jgi:polar amino acid transport system substrate-binding protein
MEGTMLTRRILGLAVAALAAAVLAPPAAAQTALERIVKEKKMVVGVAPSRNLVLMNPRTKEFEGFVVDDIRNLEKLSGIKIELVETTWAGLIAGLQAKKWDAIMTGLAATPERAIAVAFTEPYAYIGFSAMVKADGPIKSFADLNKPGTVLTVVAGAMEQTYVNRRFNQPNVKAMTDVSAAILEVMQGRAAAYIGATISNAIREKERPTELRNVTFPKEVVEWNGLAHAVRYEDRDLLQFLDTYIRAMKLRGFYKDLAAKWQFTPDFATGPN